MKNIEMQRIARVGMTGPRILVSYYLGNDADPNYQLATRLIADLRDVGASVIVDEARTASDDVAQDFYQQLQLSQWAILVETPEACHSKRIQFLMQAALYMVRQERMKGALRVIATPSKAQEVPVTWNALQQFDTSKDYSRALAGVLIAMNMERSVEAGGVRLGTAPPPVNRPHRSLSSTMTAMMRSFSQLAHVYQTQRLLLITLMVRIVLLLLSSLILAAGLAVGTRSEIIHPSKSITAQSRATAKKAPSPFPPMPGTLVLDDPLTQQDAGNWMQHNGSSSSCTFIGGTFDVSISQPNHRETCLAQALFVNDFAFQVEMTLFRGDMGGLAFRSNASDSTFYHFYLRADGQYELYVLGAKGGLRALASGDLNIDAHQTNLLAVVARGDHIMLYVNNSLIVNVHDDTLRAGTIGLIAKDLTGPTEVIFKNAKLWQL
jgi:hypothetical protein